MPILGFSQNTDSLKMLLKIAKHDTIRCKVLITLGEIIYTVLPDSAYNIWAIALNIAEKNSGELNNNHPFYKMYLKYQADALNNIAYIEKKRGQINNAITNNEKSLKLSKEIGDKNGVAYSLNNIGVIYYNQGTNDKALEYYGRSLEIREDIGDNSGIASTLINIGTIYFDERNMAKALECFNKSLMLYETIGDKGGAASAIGNIAGIYIVQAKYTKALEYLFKSLKTLSEIGDKKAIAFSLSNIGLVYFRENKLDKALTFSLNSLKMSQDLGYPSNIVEAARNLNAIYKRKLNYRKALESYELYILMRDSINNLETKRAAVKNQLKNEYEKKEIAIKTSAKAKQEKTQLKANETAKRQNLIIYGVVSGLIIVLVFSFFIFRSLQENKRKNVIITEHKHIVDEKQKEILDSIHYAKRIQTALITSEKYIERSLNNLNTN